MHISEKMKMTSAPSGSTMESAFQCWAPLLTSCRSYAERSGWRFSLDDFSNTNSAFHRSGSAMQAARVEAAPVVREWGDRIREISRSERLSDGRLDGGSSGLLQEFELCQRLVANEAVMNSMHAMCRALGLEEALKKERLASGDATDGADDDCAYQDVTQPLEVIARRLFNYKAMVESDANAELRRRRILEATFIVEFGLAFGLPDRSDRTADEMLVEFLERVREWGGNNTESAKLLLETLPPGPAHQSLRKVLTDWLEENKTWVVRGGAVLGVIGVIAASIAVAHATSDRRSPANGHGQHLSGHGRRNGGA